jgi:hypothetical protein
VKFKIDEANIIVIASVITAAPRWITALLSSQGIAIPADMVAAWTYISFACAVGMAVVEAFAMKYVWHAYRGSVKGSPQSKVLVGLVVAASLVFVLVLAPDIYAQAQHKAVGDILEPWVLALWSVMVALSTIVIISAVGFAMRKDLSMKSTDSPRVSMPETIVEKTVKIADYSEYKSMCYGRNGHGPVLPVDLIKDYNVPKSSAYAWYSRYVREIGDGK